MENWKINCNENKNKIYDTRANCFCHDNNIDYRLLGKK